MGQKVNPIGIRLGINRTWDSVWYDEKKQYSTNLHEDIRIKNFIGKEISVKVDEVACAQDAGQMSEAVVTKWSVVTKH